MSRVEHFLTVLTAPGRRRYTLDALWVALAQTDPDATFAPDRRELLLELLQQAEAAGRLRLSKGALDRSAMPVLPQSVTVLSAARGTQGRQTSGTVWPTELAWANDLRLDREELTFLVQVRNFLREVSPDEPVVPLRERSLQITGDEKRLDQLLRTRLFDAGRLSLTLLRSRQVHPPFVWKKVGPAATLLVIENHHTFDSISQVLSASDGVGVLAYGAGNQFAASVAFAADLSRVPERILYFGDLDPEGLMIPARANATARLADLPPVEAATGLYRALLEWGRPTLGGRVSAMIAQEAVSWLPHELRAQVEELLLSGSRMAQEGLGLSLLRRKDVRRSAFSYT